MSDFCPSVNAPNVLPLASAKVNVELNSGLHEYEFGFVNPARYSLGYTCVAQHDDPDSAHNADDNIATFKIFADAQNVLVTADQDSVQNFPVN
ncbi:hypothetical protein [Shewanella sp. NIFS-20-20]|uniref:hypothetical protein n=1 Tax=Shewanella sp. NIFS-20-20 TaxID=2853806 RepID=UPI00210A05A0|nr:hypothetical protein [Shewanella sp. NIFS-20-20]